MRDRTQEIRMFEDTMQILKQGWYEKNGRRIALKLTAEQMQEIQVYLPEDVRENSSRADFQPPIVIGRCGHGCENMDSFALSRKRKGDTYLFSKDDKGILVLNLASAVHPGGGVRRGARAQEEDLCRKSSLLLSLESEAAKAYYDYNKSLNSLMGSDALMITPQVEIIKDENGELLDDTVIVSVLTCAAPNIARGMEGMGEKEYQDMVYNRIMGMLKCVAYLGYRHLVLGAWGCGAFGNDAHIISDLFYKALKEIEYNHHREADLFRRIDFAVLDRTPEQYNYKEFYRNFSFDNFYRESNKPEPVSQTKFTAVRGDITKDHGVQAIVNAANTSLLGGGGVDGAIHRAAGPELLAECRMLNGCKTGQAKITKAYRIPCEHIIHTPGPHWSGGNNHERELLASCYRSCLELAVKNGIRSIAFPSIATGIYHFPLDEAAQIAVSTATEFVQQHPGELDEIKWVLYDMAAFKAYTNEIEQWEIS